MRCDHVPRMYGEPLYEVGSGTLGRLFVLGYLRGLIEAAGKAV